MTSSCPRDVGFPRPIGAKSGWLRRCLYHGVLLSACAVLTLAVRNVLKGRYIEERHRIELAGRARRTGELLASWNSFPSVPLDTGSAVKDLLLAIEPAIQDFSTAEKDALRREMPRVLSYLASPDPEKYWRLKTNQVTRYTKAPEVSTLLVGTNRAREGLSEAERISAYWSAGWTNAAGIPRISAFVPGSVRIAHGGDASHGAVFNGRASLGFTMAVRSMDPGIHYPVSTTPDTNSFLYVGLLARTSTSTNTAPIHFSLQWIGEDRRWVPHALFADGLLDFRTVF